MSVPLTLFGAVLLWFGWFGFNGGSALGANGVAAQAILTTNLAAAAAALTWMLLSSLDGEASAVGAATGAVVGLVAITPACGYVDVLSSIFIGAVGSLFSFLSIKTLSKLGVQDSLDVFACHRHICQQGNKHSRSRRGSLRQLRFACGPVWFGGGSMGVHFCNDLFIGTGG
jgi:Amt family ammonium transporter